LAYSASNATQGKENTKKEEKCPPGLAEQRIRHNSKFSFDGISFGGEHKEECEPSQVYLSLEGGLQNTD
jgi:hypothetical protein